jgi:bacterioferritin
MPPKKSATKKAAPAASPLVDTLNDLRARELAVIVQYMRQHYTVTGADGLALMDEFKEVAVTEMKHAEELAERIDFLGGDPTTIPAKIVKTDNHLMAMAEADLASEEEAVMLYTKAIAEAHAAGDTTTRRLLESILADEEDHVATFQQMLGK